MKPADDPDLDYALLVMRGYDQIASVYEASRADEVEPDLNMLIELLVPGAEILDIGCGAGVPITKALSQHFNVMGVDFSREMIVLAQKNVPEATFYCADIMDIDLPVSHFDAALSFYTIFHLPKERQRPFFERVKSWLKDGGYLLITLAREDESPYTEEFLGVTMYWSNFGLNDYIKMLDELGFEIIKITSVGHGYSEGCETADEDHPLILARKMVRSH
jgi:cyclopropane fatty-acyl-phospholipid synthase-like methyltransferase